MISAGRPTRTRQRRVAFDEFTEDVDTHIGASGSQSSNSSQSSVVRPTPDAGDDDDDDGVSVRHEQRTADAKQANNGMSLSELLELGSPLKVSSVRASSTSSISSTSQRRRCDVDDVHEEEDEQPKREHRFEQLLKPLRCALL